MTTFTGLPEHVGDLKPLKGRWTNTRSDRWNWDKHFECITCETRYPVIFGKIMCNGDAITKCPFCTPQKENKR